MGESEAVQCDPVLRVERLSKTYPSVHGDLTVLSEVGFSLAPGESCAIVGPSGSGKTTLLGLAAGLDRPTTGEVWIDQIALSSLDEDRRAQVRNEKVGFIFQSFQLLPTLTAWENVMIPLELRGIKDAADPARGLLERVGLAGRLDHYPSQLSGGEQQRVAIARAFVNRPKVLFADEPTGNLDHATAQQIIAMLFELNQREKTALVLVTHDRDLAARAGHVIRLRGGKVVES